MSMCACVGHRLLQPRRMSIEKHIPVCASIAGKDFTTGGGNLSLKMKVFVLKKQPMGTPKGPIIIPIQDAHSEKTRGQKCNAVADLHLRHPTFDIICPRG